MPFCLCNINTDFYTSPLCLPVLSTPVLGVRPLSPLGGLGGPHHHIGSLGFLGDPADHGPPLPRSRPLGAQCQSCLLGRPLEVKVGLRWKPPPPSWVCLPGGRSCCQPQTWPLGLGHYPEDSWALRVSWAGQLSFAGASATSVSSALRAWRPLALRVALGEAPGPGLGVPGTPCCAGGGVRPQQRHPRRKSPARGGELGWGFPGKLGCHPGPAAAQRGGSLRSAGRWGAPAGGDLEGLLGTQFLLRPPGRKQYSGLLYWASPWGHL